MIQYDSDDIRELDIVGFIPRIERRDEQWIDIVLRMELADERQVHESITDLTALVICNMAGAIAQIVPQDEDCDCEFQFTASEKEKIRQYVQSTEIQQEITKLAAYG